MFFSYTNEAVKVLNNIEYKNIQNYWLVREKSRVLNLRNFRPFQNDILIDSLTSLTHESKFYATFRSVGVLKIWLHLGLGVGLRGQLE